jgi:hypothetical protein
MKKEEGRFVERGLNLPIPSHRNDGLRHSRTKLYYFCLQHEQSLYSGSKSLRNDIHLPSYPLAIFI